MGEDGISIGNLDYRLPEAAHLRLLETRDHLRLLACLTASRSRQEDNPGELQMTPSMLSQCFQRLADELEAVVECAQWLGMAVEDQGMQGAKPRRGR